MQINTAVFILYWLVCFISEELRGTLGVCGDDKIFILRCYMNEGTGSMIKWTPVYILYFIGIVSNEESLEEQVFSYFKSVGKG